MRTLVLCNGGLKSTFLAVMAKKEGETALCYLRERSSSRAELRRVVKLAKVLEVPLFLIELTQLPSIKETLLRMLFQVLFALPLAKERNCHYIYHGLSKDDDRRLLRILDEYIVQLNTLIELGQPRYDGEGFWLGQTALETPLRKLTRAHVVRLGHDLHVPWQLSFSCEQHKKVHCGRCVGCLRRQRSFKEEGHEDPTVYEKDISNV